MHDSEGRKVSASFLKKRSKKLLSLRVEAIHRRCQNRGPENKSFLLLFFKKEALAYFLSFRPKHPLKPA
jgi:hypothetical protein